MKLHRHLTGLALALSLWACESVGRVTEPRLEAGESLQTSSKDVSTKGERGGKKQYVFVSADFAAGPISAEIGVQGGVMILADRVILEVPRHAVKQRTVFTMEKVPGDELIVKLTATSTKRNATLNDVGSAGFPVPLKLTFRYADVEGVDEGKLQVLYVAGANRMVPQPSVVDPIANELTGEITHFSPYGAGWPE